MDIIRRFVFHLRKTLRFGYWTVSVFRRHYVSGTGFCLRLGVELAQLGPTNRASLSPVYWAQMSRFYTRREKDSSLRNTVF
jgi:hypothetical protein